MKDGKETSMVATQLHVRLERDGIGRMRLALPPHAAQRISQLIPPQLAEEARVRGIDLEIVEQAVRDGDLTPRELVDYLSDEGRHITIWLE
jgi:hypothetical protein